MLLSKLEIKGFKSFGDKVTLNFDKGITAVVGPNGSGKSNVVDAIRWVLGEQSTKALRSEKMENIIFNGTSRRKPLQMAEVSLTFLNNRSLLPTEFTEVTISRRYYRSGDSEYMLNGVTCRLKDIQSLFLDTGIGSDSYAIIELKMVDEILNDTNNSRRDLFEEAAGISKFKKRKKETLKKLKDTDADLERVEDLLHEISKNMKALERQAKQAQKYIQLKKEYKELSISLARQTVASQLDEMQQVAQALQTENTQRDSISKQMQEMEGSLSLEKEALLQKEKLLSSRQKTLNEHVYKIRQIENDKKIKGERKRFLEEKKVSIKQQLESDTVENQQLSISVSSLKTQLTSVEKILGETEYLLNNYQTQYETQKAKSDTLKHQVQEVENKLKAKQASLFQLKKELEIHQVQLSTLKQELEREHSANAEKSANLTQFDLQYTKLKTEKDTAQEEFDTVIQKRDEHEKNILELQEKYDTLKEQATSKNRLLDAKQNEYNLTKSLVENLEGYPEAIQYMKQNTDIGQNAPLLSDIIACEEQYRLAIENYLEPYLNYFILPTEDDAWQAVNVLDEAKKGKAFFLLLDKFTGYQPSQRKAIPNAIPALEVIEFDEHHKDLVTFMLDNVYIVTNNQNNLPKDDSIVVITKNGKSVRKRIAISGGSVGEFEGKTIGRAKNLEKLSVEIESLTETVSKSKEEQTLLAEKLSTLKVISYKTEVEDKRRALQLRDQALIKIQTQKEEFTKFLTESEHKKENILDRIHQSETIIETNQPKVISEEEEIEILTEQLEILQDDAKLESDKYNQLSAQFNQQNILFHQQQNQVESLEKEIAYKESDTVKSKSRLESNIEELQKVEQELAQFGEVETEEDERLVSLREEKLSIEAGVREAEKSFMDARTKINDLDKALRDFHHKKENTDQIKMDLNNRLNEIRLSLTSMKEKMMVEFEVDLEKVVEMEDEENENQTIPIEELKEKVQTTKQKLDKIGPINHTAIDAYNEIKERNDFITEQKNDLEKAKNTLIQTITEIDTVAKENFLDAFHKIRDNFMDVFRSLFTEEDKCDLRLADDNDPLGCKIEIMAQPKGKRPLTINQLSGGEKTLTATALLFAIYLLKPAPFCIFDEVDAPLDDANVSKFTRIIKKFSDKSQFIMVTHNKRTMASTDIIYGVTMIEQGVTTVVPVDIRDTPELKGFSN